VKISAYCDEEEHFESIGTTTENIFMQSMCETYRFLTITCVLSAAFTTIFPVSQKYSTQYTMCLKQFSIFIAVEKVIVNAAITDLFLFNMKINRQKESFSCPCHKVLFEEYKYNLTSALDGGEWLI
jgi:hypothetical protein